MLPVRRCLQLMSWHLPPGEVVIESDVDRWPLHFQRRLKYGGQRFEYPWHTRFELLYHDAFDQPVGGVDYLVHAIEDRFDDVIDVAVHRRHGKVEYGGGQWAAIDLVGLLQLIRMCAGQLANFTGIDSPYEAPEHPEIHIDTTGMTADEAADLIIKRLIP